jgi:DsbC/DsbD-like thiol-disulfide interchange protein
MWLAEPSAPVRAQATDPSWLKASKRVSAEASVEPQKPGARPGTVLVAVDVRPAPGIHVYAPGNKDYIPVALTVTPSPGVNAGPVEYPAAETLVFGESKEVVRVYARPFRIRVPITIRSDRRNSTLAADLRVQACTDKVCFPPETLPLSVALPTASSRKSP